MPQDSAAVLRSMPSSTSASASIRRAAALFFSPPAALRSSDAVRSSRVIDTAAPIDAAPLKSQHRVRVSLIWESLTSHSLGPLVLLIAAWARELKPPIVHLGASAELLFPKDVALLKRILPGLVVMRSIPV